MGKWKKITRPICRRMTGLAMKQFDNISHITKKMSLNSVINWPVWMRIVGFEIFFEE